MKNIFIKFLVVCLFVSCLFGVISCKKSGEESSSSVSVESGQSSDSKTASVISVEEKIDALPDFQLLTLSDKDVVLTAEKEFNKLNDGEKASVENYEKLHSLLLRIEFLSNVNSGNIAIESIPDENGVTLADIDVINAVNELIGALSDEERSALSNYNKLVKTKERLTSLIKIDEVNTLISSLPLLEDIDESTLDELDKIENLYSALTDNEKNEVVNASYIDEARGAVTSSYWKDTKVRKHYSQGRDLTFNVNLKQNTVSKLIIDGNEQQANTYSYQDGVFTVKESLLSTLDTGIYTCQLVDSNGKDFKFLVGVGYDEKSTAYFDFDVSSFTNPDVYGVPNTVVDDGIDGKSGRFTKDSAFANVFGFFKGGEYGFVNYTFKTNEVYLLEFDIKILSATNSEWWMPIYFGGKGDVCYLYDDYSLVFPQVNTLFSEGSIERNGEYAHVKAVFKATNETANLEFANWGGGVDLILDNLLLTVLPKTAVNEVNELIDGLPNEIKLSDKDKINTAKSKYDALGLAQKETVLNVEKLLFAYNEISLIELSSTVVDMIDKLPSVDSFTTNDYEAIYAAKSEFNKLSVTAQSYVDNYDKLKSLLTAIGTSYWDESKIEFYVKSTQEFSVKVELLDNGVKSLTLNGKALQETEYVYSEGVLSFGEYFAQKEKDVYTAVLTDGVDNSFTFYVYLDITEGSAVYYDFDYYTYSNTDGVAVPSTQYADGIQGKSQRFTKTNGGGTVFGYFKNGSYGFVPYAFESDATYTLSFDIKILDGTAEGWWMPIFFSGGKGDLLYVRHNGSEVFLQTYSLDALNAKNRQSVKDNGDGSYRVSVTFTLKANETYDNIEFSSWDGAIDILLDNVLLVKE